MVLEDVPDRARVLVVGGAALDAEGLGDRDLDVVDELAVPDRLEDAVREPQREHVLDRFLAEVVVDPEDLFLGEVLADQGGQLAGGGEVVAERLLDDQAHPASGFAALTELSDDRRHRLRRDGEVVDAVPARAALLVDLVQEPGEVVLTALVGEVERDVARRLGQPVPDVLVEVVAAELADGVLHLVAELVVRPVRAGGADDRELLRQELAAGERVERGEDLAVRQVAGGAEDDEHARLRRAPSPSPSSSGFSATGASVIPALSGARHRTCLEGTWPGLR